MDSRREPLAYRAQVVLGAEASSGHQLALGGQQDLVEWRHAVGG